MKKIIKVAALSVSVMALASTVFGADININIFGASAEAKFWNAYAKTFLETPTASGGMGCTGTTKVGFADSAKKLGISVGQTCAATGGGKVFIRYTSDKSVEGPRAVMHQDPNGISCQTGSTNGNRTQADWDGTSATFTTSCLPVHVGSSDVASEAFTQESHGNYNGNYTTTNVDYTLDPATIPGLTQIGTASQPIVVPFSFFANTNLNINQINRQQAVLLFSGNVSNWSQFGPGYDNKQVVLCMRHAGSGTHATLDKAILRGDRTLAQQTYANVPFDAGIPGTLFHQGTGDVINCVNDNGQYPTTGASAAAAIGYADSDAIVDTAQGTLGYDANGNEYKTTAAANIKRLKYNGGGEGMTAANKTAYGYSALKNEIINGSYEFWSAQWMYINKADATVAASTKTTYDKMMAFASTASLPCPGIGCYWLTGSNLKVSKEDDSAVPHF